MAEEQVQKDVAEEPEQKDVPEEDQLLKELLSIKPVIHSDTLKIACAQLVDMYIIREEYFFLGREVGKLLRWGELGALGILTASDEAGGETPNLDVFGKQINKNWKFVCECPVCKKKMDGSKLAPHLEKCLGMGRSSARVASRRITINDNYNGASGGNLNRPKEGAGSGLDSSKKTRRN